MKKKNILILSLFQPKKKTQKRDKVINMKKLSLTKTEFNSLIPEKTLYLSSSGRVQIYAEEVNNNKFAVNKNNLMKENNVLRLNINSFLIKKTFYFQESLFLNLNPDTKQLIFDYEEYKKNYFSIICFSSPTETITYSLNYIDFSNEEHIKLIYYIENYN